jgi:hypothetical protein
MFFSTRPLPLFHFHALIATLSIQPILCRLADFSVLNRLDHDHYRGCALRQLKFRPTLRKKQSVTDYPVTLPSLSN